ncbi:MAG: peptide chain release factor N(5)-glutamine methyltransferase [Clostridiales bacterium]|jgi:release factor glutamine methyltransferase|nr:peptide chain release factor N(5)-glutamine methyltransferase [Clostridiales bacterium]
MSVTIKEALLRASFLLREAGVENPRREAEALLCAGTGFPLAHIYAHGEETLTEELHTRYLDWITRRAGEEPFAYICGEREFMGLPFRVTPDVLIPRPETEFLVEATVAALAPYSQPHILEVGTGSGAVAVMLAVLLPGAQVTSVDTSLPAITVAADNAARHGVADRVRLLTGDIYAPAAAEEIHFTAVVSNPPYIPTAEIDGLAPGVKEHEPLQALDGGPDGLTFYRRLTRELVLLSHLPDILAFEVGAGQAHSVIQLCHTAGYKKTRQVKDLAGIERVITATRL